ncbi:MAG TPA: histidinol dehydrogenase [Chitinophagaceae bacterium]|nr:histidinol dehydrogenase [Chitinophagaceae bacterium]
MKLFTYPGKNEWGQIIKRPVINTMELQTKVRAVLDDVKHNGNTAVRKYTSQFESISLDDIAAGADELAEAEGLLTDELKTAISTAAGNIRAFHKNQFEQPVIIETMPGIACWRKSVGIDKVGIYIPGGTAPLFSTVLMLAIPAAIAGCRQVVLCTPAQKNGKVHPAVLYAASICGVTQIFKVGGAQAIAAMAYGTEIIPKVYKIFGPGNQYVTCAKQLVQMEGTAIDMPAGPSEVCILADETADAGFVAADLLSQAEHGTDSQVLLVTTDNALVEKVKAEISRQLKALPRQQIALGALENSTIVLVEKMGDAIELVNEYAAEHLIIACRDDEEIAAQIINAGSIFLGNYSPESVGDYASGTNHTLPTNGFAKMYSGVSVDSFVKKITYQKLSREGLQNIGKTVETLAEAEGLAAHKNAVSVRLANINNEG